MSKPKKTKHTPAVRKPMAALARETGVRLRPHAKTHKCPDIARLQRAAEKAREELGDTERPGRGQRPAGWVAEPRPLRLPAAAR